MNILITGISKGLGLVTTKLLLEAGHTVYGISRSADVMTSLADQFPGKLHHLSYDLSNTGDIRKSIFKEWLADVKIDAFVNNAAMAYDTLLTNMDESKVIKMTMVNQVTPMLMTKYVIRNMILNNVKGSIVHLSSVSAHTGYKGLAMYAATKGALEAFSKNTAREWGTKMIRSNCVAAGFMETDMTDNMEDKLKDKIYRRTSLKKATSLDSVAETIAFLISDGSKSITGQVVHVDSGTI